MSIDFLLSEQDLSIVRCSDKLKQLGHTEKDVAEEANAGAIERVAGTSDDASQPGVVDIHAIACGFL